MKKGQSMTPNEIKAAILRAGTNQAAIASYLDVTVQSVWRVVNGTMRSARIEAELEKITGCPIHASVSRRGRKKAVWSGERVAA
ncbi:helix-turn-helix domain-containing protein [Limnohabitans sp. TS-CS-82]|uniref:helix-turn-helix domain-containing protein n=1 Tax=Limnohabitans sp. TS-CS-82 TaxID=2094193 RepID=UPI0013752618|nr:helix-turn-helix domain-containing protein [Limnohabitans sp. TS-CS-82]